jgi:hypothetical protein
MVLYLNLIYTRCLVRNLAFSLSRRCLIIYIDNYFTSIPLFSELRTCEFGVVGTIRPHKDFPIGLKELKDRFSTKLEWNTLLAVIVQDIFCLAWQDKNIILALSNIHTVDKVEDFREKIRKHLIKIFTNSRIVRQVFGNNHQKELCISCFIDDYNHYMGGIDLANQYRETFETHRPTCRTWWPLLYWLFDIAYINTYRLYRLHITSRPFTYLQFRIELYYKLLGYSTKAKLQNL